METIGKRVTSLRLGMRLSISELARRCDVSQPSISNIESGKTKGVKGYVLEALARELNTTTAFLLDCAQNNQGHELSMMLAEIVAIFQRLAVQDQHALLRTARGMLQASAPKPSHLAPFKRPTEAKV